MSSEGYRREASRLAGFAESRFCLFGQVLEWQYGDFDDRSGSENLTE